MPKSEPEHDHLLQAVLQNPDADVPRTAYATWCMSQPDAPTLARGEFIHTQLRLASRRDDRPVDLRNDLLHTEMTLQRNYARTWAREIGSLVDEHQYHRGFVSLVTLPARRFLEVAPRLFALAPIRHLNLTEAATVAKELFVSPHLLDIRSLRIGRTEPLFKGRPRSIPCETALLLRLTVR